MYNRFGVAQLACVKLCSVLNTLSPNSFTVSGISNSSKVPLSALLPIISRPLFILIFAALKHPFPIFLINPGRVKFLISAPPKHSAGNSVRFSLSSITRWLSDRQPEKAPTPSSITQLGIVTESSSVQPIKAPLPILKSHSLPNFILLSGVWLKA